jgi:hypothetical protein
VRDFKNEYTFQIKKELPEYGKTFSIEAYEVLLKAIKNWIDFNVFENWACKELTIHVKLEGKYEPSEKDD